MKLYYHEMPFPHVIIDDTLNEDEFDKILLEIFLLQPSMVGPEGTSAASEPGGKQFKKSGKGRFLDNFYTQRDFSPTLTAMNKIFSHEMRDFISRTGWFFKQYYFCSNQDSTLIQSYDNGDYYKSHHDSFLFTSVTMIYREPKKFSGGQLTFPEDNYEIDLKNNQTIIFPSRIAHQVEPVIKQSTDQKDNRFTISKFIWIDKNIEDEQNLKRLEEEKNSN